MVEGDVRVFCHSVSVWGLGNTKRVGKGEEIVRTDPSH